MKWLEFSGMDTSLGNVPQISYLSLFVKYYWVFLNITAGIVQWIMQNITRPGEGSCFIRTSPTTPVILLVNSQTDINLVSDALNMARGLEDIFVTTLNTVSCACVIPDMQYLCRSFLSRALSAADLKTTCIPSNAFHQSAEAFLRNSSFAKSR